jgi:3-hydroxyacyl-[acyl-carrier-protein] dehydratase
MKFLDNLLIIKNIADTEDGFAVTLTTEPDNVIYKAHFPGNPITPGACLIQTAGEILQQRLGKRLFLKSSKNIKFLNTLIPAKDREVTFSYTKIEEGEAEYKTQVVVSDPNTVYTKMSLTYSYE